MGGFLERLRQTPLVFDGAMGTMLYARGVFINTCYDQLNLTRPDLVREIHRGYVEAGVDVIETNTYGANRVKLRAHGLAEEAEAINRAAVALARAEAGADVLVAGDMGPCLTAAQAWRPELADEVGAAFAAQARVLADAGADLILLETFVHGDELAVAAEAARATGLPVVASFTTSPQGETVLGGNIEALAARLDADANVDVVGINCGVGPAYAYEAAERLVRIVAKPLLVMPNAGMPEDVDGRMIYLSSPEYFTEYAKKLIELGVRAIGGCCGTTPEHLRVAARAIRSLSGVKRHAHVRVYTREEVAVEAVPTERKSRLAARLCAGEKVTSVELLPPKSCDLSALIAKASECHAHGIDAINIPDGPRASARVSPMVAALTLLREVGIEPVLHYCCRDRNLIGMQSDLLGAHVAGVRNILIITGDPPKLGDYPDVTGVFDVDAIGLTQVAANLNHGRDIGGNPVVPPPALLLGVGANPCAVNLEHEIERYFAKLEAGAEFVITQPVFDAGAMLHFLDRIEAHGRRVPVIAGVWPLVSFKNAEFMRNEVPGVVVPDAVLERMASCTGKEESVAMGVRLAGEICERLYDRVAGFQISAPFGRVDLALRALSMVGLVSLDERVRT